MSPRPLFVTALAKPFRRTQLTLFRPASRFYSQSAAGEPLILVTNIPAPNTGHIRILELNRPSARNAISRALLADLREQVDDVGRQYDANGNEVASMPRGAHLAGVGGGGGPTRALIIASAVDSCFCAGADLKERKGFTQEE